MTAPLTTYDGDRVTVAFGPILADGLADGEFITIVENVEIFTIYVGTDGKVTRSKTANKTARATLTLGQSSDCNDKLSVASATDRTAGNGAGIMPLLVRDRGGRSLYTMPYAWIAKAPDVSFGREAGPRVWVFEGLLERFDGGN